MTTPRKGLFSVMLKSPPLSQLIKESLLVGGKPVGNLPSVENLSFRSPRLNPFGSLSWGFN